jgi:hypothetical protein
MSPIMFFALMLGQFSCSDGECAIVPRRVEWHSRADEPGRIYLYVSGRQVGGYDGERDQAPDGAAKHRQDDYRGPEKLAEAIRRADPNYRPERDPDLNRPTLFPSFHFPTVPG